MTAESFREVGREGGWVNLSVRAKWRVTGADRVRYLNGQVTNDVRKAGMEDAVYACVTNAKGRIEGDLFIHAAPDTALVLDAEPGLRESLAARLDKYLVADDVVIEDVTDGWRLFHVFGLAAERERWAGPIPPACFGVVRNERLAMPGLDVWIDPAAAAPDFNVRELSPREAEILRICRGVPRWPHELNADTFPQEAALERRAMDFSKGCYIGQEVLSRIKTTGRMPRKLVKFQVAGPDLMDQIPASFENGAAWRLFARSSEGPKEAGVVTSACLHPVLDRVTGLGYVRQGLEQEPSLLLAQQDAPGILIELEIPKQ